MVHGTLHIFFEDLEKQIALSERKPPLVYMAADFLFTTVFKTFTEPPYE